jgi:glycine oxidase
LTKRPSSSFDVAVVGGGVIGLSIAWRAAQRGLRVVVLERGGLGAGTTFVAAGMIAPVSEARATEQALLELNMRSARAYPGFASELAEASGLDAGFLTCGTIAAARDRDEAEALERELTLRQSLGLPVQRLLPSQARRAEPALAPALRLGLDIPDDHAIDPRQLVAALARAAADRGAELRTGVSVESVRCNGDRVEGVQLAGGEQVLAENVVVAAGVWSGRIGGIPESARVPLRPVKGQIMHLHDPAGPGLLTHAVRIMAPGALYVVPRGDGRYVLGATVEERGFDTAVTAGALFELLRDATELLPGLSELVIDELTAGLRPATPDNAPALGPAAGVSGLHWAVGHYRHGVLLAPVTAELVVGGLLGDELPPEVSPARFTGVTVPC